MKKPAKLYKMNPVRIKLIILFCSSILVSNAQIIKVDTSFHDGAGLDWIVYDLAIQPDNKIVIGGSFDTDDNFHRRYLVRVDTDGILDPTFNVSDAFPSTVTSIHILQDGKIIIGGDFI